MPDSRLVIAVIGLFLIFYPLLFFPPINFVIFLSGWILFFYSLNEIVFHYDKFHLDNIKEYIVLIFLGTVVTISIEWGGQILNPAWIYSYSFFQGINFLTSLAAYILFIPASVESYLFVKNVLKTKSKDVRKRSLIFLLFGLGIVLTLMGIFWKFQPPYEGTSFAFYILGISFIVDTVVYGLIKHSIYVRALHSLKYAVTIVLASFIIAFPSEFLNTFKISWEYTNFPLLEYTILNVPLSILIGWIPLVILWLEIYYLSEYLFISKKDRKKFI